MRQRAAKPRCMTASTQTDAMMNFLYPNMVVTMYSIMRQMQETGEELSSNKVHCNQ
jgi:hypothetical protein